MVSTRLFSAGLSAAIAAASLTLGAGQASAHKPRTCTDGTVVSDSRRCPPKSMTASSSANDSAGTRTFELVAAEGRADRHW